MTSVDTTTEIVESLVAMQLVPAGTPVSLQRLEGGVSSDIYRADFDGGPVCVKRALPKLRVAADWRAPVERNAYECAWIRTATALSPGIAPEILGEDPARATFAMQYLDPAGHPLWKAQLRDGEVDPGFAAAVARRLAAVHAGTAGDPEVAARFATDANFAALRIEPYLLAAAATHPDLKGCFEAIAARTLATKRALVHGDVSPKNILVGPAGPVFLDAECAWYGDPAFDVAFCLNHLLLKSVWRPASTSAYLASFDAFRAAYLQGVDWEEADDLEGRAAHLLPALLLARVDGKSPVEYIQAAADKDTVRAWARPLMAEPVDGLGAVADVWRA